MYDIRRGEIVPDHSKSGLYYNVVYWLKCKEQDGNTDDTIYSIMLAYEKAIRPTSRWEWIPWEKINWEFYSPERHESSWVIHEEYLTNANLCMFNNPIGTNHLVRWNRTNQYSLYQNPSWNNYRWQLNSIYNINLL